MRNRFRVPLAAFRVRIVQGISRSDGKIPVVIVYHLAGNGKSQTRIRAFLIRTGYYLSGNVSFKSFENGGLVIRNEGIFDRNVPKQTNARIRNGDLETRRYSSIILCGNEVRAHVTGMVDDVIEQLHGNVFEVF